MFFHQSINHILLQRSEDLDVTFCIIIAHVQPELIELIRSGTLRIEPDITTLGLTELLTVALGNQRTGEREGFHLITQCTTDKLSTGGHITPLIITT